MLEQILHHALEQLHPVLSGPFWQLDDTADFCSSNLFEKLPCSGHEPVFLAQLGVNRVQDLLGELDLTTDFFEILIKVQSATRWLSYHLVE